jgi:hypothetical protein
LTANAGDTGLPDSELAADPAAAAKGFAGELTGGDCAVGGAGPAFIGLACTLAGEQ